MTLADARAGDQDAFAALVAPHRHELKVHCYRMLGSPADADDALQEALLAAWRGLAGFEERSSLRAWLYRIATNCSLRMVQARKRQRMLSWDHGPARSPDDDLAVVEAGPWLEPWTDPASAYERTEAISLAYVAALQHLPPNQRAVLILREVLDFSAAEVAEQLDTSVASVNSALQRARATVAARVPAPDEAMTATAEQERRALAAFVGPVAAASSLEDVLTNRSAPPATVTPVLIYPDVRAAVAWLEAAFGFEERIRIGEGHRAQLAVGHDGAVIVAESGGHKVPPTTGSATHVIKIRVPDVDAAFVRACEAGARVSEEPTSHAYGERSCSVEDLAGHRWELTQTLRDVEPEEWGGISVAPW